MPNLLPLYLYLSHQEGLSIEEIASAIDMDVEAVRTRVEAARLCFSLQCRLALDTAT